MEFESEKLSVGDSLRLRVQCGEEVREVSVLAEADADGDVFLRLRGEGCGLEGLEPGAYYPVAP